VWDTSAPFYLLQFPVHVSSVFHISLFMLPYDFFSFLKISIPYLLHPSVFLVFYLPDLDSVIENPDCILFMVFLSTSRRVPR